MIGWALALAFALGALLGLAIARRKVVGPPAVETAPAPAALLDALYEITNHPIDCAHAKQWPGTWFHCFQWAQVRAREALDVVHPRCPSVCPLPEHRGRCAFDPGHAAAHSDGDHVWS